jgi:hypothetical protein
MTALLGRQSRPWLEATTVGLDLSLVDTRIKAS